MCGGRYMLGRLWRATNIASRLCAGAAYVPCRLCIGPLMYCTEPLMCRLRTEPLNVPGGLYTEPLMCRAAYVLSRLCTVAYVRAAYVLSPLAPYYWAPSMC